MQRILRPFSNPQCDRVRRSSQIGYRDKNPTERQWLANERLVRAARAFSVCNVVFFSLNRRKNRYGYLKRALAATA
jgi:hypothetical protein